MTNQYESNSGDLGGEFLYNERIRGKVGDFLNSIGFNGLEKAQASDSADGVKYISESGDGRVKVTIHFEKSGK